MVIAYAIDVIGVIIFGLGTTTEVRTTAKTASTHFVSLHPPATAIAGNNTSIGTTS